MHFFFYNQRISIFLFCPVFIVSLIQMITSLLSSAEVWSRAVHLNQVCWSRDIKWWKKILLHTQKRLGCQVQWTKKGVQDRLNHASSETLLYPYNNDVKKDNRNCFCQRLQSHRLQIPDVVDAFLNGTIFWSLRVINVKICTVYDQLKSSRHYLLLICLCLFDSCFSPLFFVLSILQVYWLLKSFS